MLREHRLVARQRPISQVRHGVLAPPLAHQLPDTAVALLEQPELAEGASAPDLGVEVLGVALSVEGPLPSRRPAPGEVPAHLPAAILRPADAHAALWPRIVFSSEAKLSPPGRVIRGAAAGS